VKYTDLPSSTRPVPYIEELPVPNPPGNLTFSDQNSDSNAYHGQQEKDNIDCDPTLEASCSSSESNLLIEENLNEIGSDLNLSKTQSQLLGSRLKWWNLLH
jgi:hypothetical protein